MPAFADLFAMLHTVLLAGFITVTGLLMAVTIANRLRVRQVLLSWRSGRSLAFPIAPAAFVLAVICVIAYTLVTDSALSPFLFVGYLIGGVFWFVSGLLARAFVVTDCGILHNTSRSTEAMGWGQVVDYFATSREGRQEYVFIYLDRSGTRRRFETSVPAILQERFQKIVQARLDNRFDLSVEESLGKKAMER